MPYVPSRPPPHKYKVVLFSLLVVDALRVYLRSYVARVGSEPRSSATAERAQSSVVGVRLMRRSARLARDACRDEPAVR